MAREDQQARTTKLPYERERRRHPRSRVDELPILVDDGGPLRVRDLSQSGACFFSEAPLRMMTHVRFRFALEVDGEKRDAQGEGVVVRCERISPTLGHYEIAIFFQDFQDGSREILKRYLASLQKQQNG